MALHSNVWWPDSADGCVSIGTLVLAFVSASAISSSIWNVRYLPTTTVSVGQPSNKVRLVGNRSVTWLRWAASSRVGARGWFRFVVGGLAPKTLPQTRRPGTPDQGRPTGDARPGQPSHVKAVTVNAVASVMAPMVRALACRRVQDLILAVGRIAGSRIQARCGIPASGSASVRTRCG
jgi:hypothetical protein